MMKNTIAKTCFIIVSMLLLASCHKSPSQMRKQQPAVNPATPSVSSVEQTTVNASQTAVLQTPDITTLVEKQSPKVTHIQKTIEGKVIKLNINLDVKEYPGIEFGIYEAKPLQVDHDGWYEYFFRGIDKNELTHYYENWGEKYLELQGVTDDVIKNTFAYLFGDIHDPELEVYYLINQAVFRYSRGIHNTSLEEKCELIADETDRKKAESLSDEIMSFVAGDRLIRTSCDIQQPENYKDAVYITKYDRTIESLPILLDRPLGVNADAPDPIRIDSGEVWVMNGKVVYATAIVRDLVLKEQSQVISLEQALDTLELYADTVNAYSKDFADGKSNISEFDIKHIDLMYYPITIEDTSIANTYAGQHAYATYRPIWCIASGQRVSTNFEFVMIIDAVSGEVIG